jgi:threonine dehydrogenase-like Zn-dependent dehydrogenase
LNEQTAQTTRAPRALWYAAPRKADLRDAMLGHRVAEGHVRVRSLWSGISRGTERLVFEGRVPPEEADRMRCPLQEGAFPFPVKYGYCAVGVAETGDAALAGRTVFVLAPHQEVLDAPAAMVVPVPAPVPARRAILAANMETALNALWDSGAGPAERIVIVGGGVVGLCVAYLCARLPGAEVTVVDVAPQRRAVAEAFGARFALPEEAPCECDVVFHASASPAGLATAIAAAGLEAPVVELSWHGAGTTAVPLGGAFHSRRLRLISSQVGLISTARRARFTYRRRLEAALALLADPVLDHLITREIAFADLPQQLPSLLDDPAALTAAVRYG